MSSARMKDIHEHSAVIKTYSESRILGRLDDRFELHKKSTLKSPEFKRSFATGSPKSKIPVSPSFLGSPNFSSFGFESPFARVTSSVSSTSTPSKPASAVTDKKEEITTTPSIDRSKPVASTPSASIPATPNRVINIVPTACDFCVDFVNKPKRPVHKFSKHDSLMNTQENIDLYDVPERCNRDEERQRKERLIAELKAEQKKVIVPVELITTSIRELIQKQAFNDLSDDSEIGNGRESTLTLVEPENPFLMAPMNASSGAPSGARIIPTEDANAQVIAAMEQIIEKVKGPGIRRDLNQLKELIKKNNRQAVGLQNVREEFLFGKLTTALCEINELELENIDMAAHQSKMYIRLDLYSDRLAQETENFERATQLFRTMKAKLEEREDFPNLVKEKVIDDLRMHVKSSEMRLKSAEKRLEKSQDFVSAEYEQRKQLEDRFIQIACERHEAKEELERAKRRVAELEKENEFYFDQFNKKTMDEPDEEEVDMSHHYPESSASNDSGANNGQENVGEDDDKLSTTSEGQGGDDENVVVYNDETSLYDDGADVNDDDDTTVLSPQSALPATSVRKIHEKVSLEGVAKNVEGTIKFATSTLREEYIANLDKAEKTGKASAPDPLKGFEFLGWLETSFSSIKKSSRQSLGMPKKRSSTMPDIASLAGAGGVKEDDVIQKGKKVLGEKKGFN